MRSALRSPLPPACSRRRIAVAATGWLYARPRRRRAGAARRRGAAAGRARQARRRRRSLCSSLVWAAAAAALGLPRAGRASSGSIAAIACSRSASASGPTSTTGVSIAIVRQIPPRDALHARRALRAVYLPAALARLAAALSRAGATRRRARAAPARAARGRRRRARARSTPMLPRDDDGLLRSLTPDAVGPLAHALGPPLGLALLFAARGLARRRHRAWQVAVVLAALSATLHVLHGVNHGHDRLRCWSLILLVARRQDFTRPATATRVASRVRGARCSRPGRHRAYGGGGALGEPARRRPPVHAPFAGRETTSGLLGPHDARARPTSPAPFGDWFPLRVFLLGHRRRPCRSSQAGSRRGGTGCARRRTSARRSRALVQGVGHRHALAVRAARGQVVLLQRRRGGVPRLPGRRRGRDRLGRPDRRAGRVRRAVGRFVEHAHARDWRIAILGASGAAARALPRARPARAVPRRRGGRRHRRVLPRGPGDPQGAPVGTPARARRLPAPSCSTRARSRRAAGRARVDRARLARRPSRSAAS